MRDFAFRLATEYNYFHQLPAAVPVDILYGEIVSYGSQSGIKTLIVLLT